MNSITWEFKPVPPFRLDLTVWALRRRPQNIWDRWDGQNYRRVLYWNGHNAEATVRQTAPPTQPRLEVTLHGSRLNPELKSPIQNVLEKMLGLRVDLAPFYILAEQDARLHALASRFRGLKPPRFPSVFEALVNAITCQQFTLTSCVRILNRVVANHGAVLRCPSSPVYDFPRPENFAGLDIEHLKKYGYSRQKAGALIGLARRIVEGMLSLEDFDSLDDDTARERLEQLPGVGRWTADYTLLRGLGRTHIFPAGDVGARNKFQQWLRLRKKPEYPMILRLLRKWQPYGGLIYFHLLLAGLVERGVIHDASNS